MKKLKLEIPILLPEIEDEKDQCVHRLLDSLNAEKGIKEAHIAEGIPAKICIHYDPNMLTLKRVKSIAVKNGADITHRFKHAVWEVKGIRHQRHARNVEESLMRIVGIVGVSASASGTLMLEWDTKKIKEEGVISAIHNIGIRIRKEKDHVHEGGHEHDQDQQQNGLWGENTELIFAISSGAFWLIGLVCSFISGIPEWVPIGAFIIGLFFGGYYTMIEAVKEISKGKFQIDFLMLVAAGGAAALGKWGEGALLLFLFSLGHALEHYAMNRARKSISALSELAPRKATVIRDGQQQEVGIDALEMDDIILVKPNSKIAADGVVVSGNSSVNQAPITGESLPVDKYPVENPKADFNLNKLPAENRVFAGTINGSHVLEVRVLRLASDSTLSRLIELVKEAETQKSPTQQLADKFEKYYVPGVLFMVVLLLFAFLVIDETFAESFYRAMAVLIAASPCALAISTPSAVLAGVARAAKQGVLIKGGRPLEDLGELSVLAFDKTGTLTEGKPRLTHAIPYGDVARDQLLSAAIAVELLSDHPLASAIAEDGENLLGKRVAEEATKMESLTAKGVRAIFKEEVVHIGNRRLMEEVTRISLPSDLEVEMSALEETGHTVMIVHSGDKYLGVISVMDIARVEAKATLQKLKDLGIRRMIMLTGDHQKVADAVARELGISDPMGSLMPEDKVMAIERAKVEMGKVAMVGDGVNDAPAMARSTVGIAMGAAGSDVALETADIALMADKLDNLPFAIGLSRQAKRIIKQNLWISLGMVAILVPLTIFGIAEIGPAVVAHEGSTLVVVLNALRLLGYE
jgi:Cd2+/Zn2+-exporting ATPase